MRGKRRAAPRDPDYVVAVLISPDLSIPDSEFSYRATRAGGPGGQHVNTSSTRVELWWDLVGSPSLSDDQRRWLMTRLAARIDSEGWLRLVSARSRSQLQNRKDVTERFRTVLAQAMVVPRKRKKTRPSKAAKERRLAGKKRTAIKKDRRKKPSDDE